VDPVGDVFVVLAAAEHAHEGECEQLGQRVAGVITSRIGHRFKIAQDTAERVSIHAAAFRQGLDWIAGPGGEVVVPILLPPQGKPKGKLGSG